MADKNFGVKGINFVGDPGTPTISIASSTITYAGNLNLNSPTVAISTDVSIGGKVVSNLVVSDTYSVGIGTTVLTEKLNVSGNANISGVVSATGFVGSGVSLTGLLTNQSSAIDTGEYQYLLVTPQTSGTISSVSSSYNYIAFNPAAKYLGIGTNTPIAGLDVSGTGRFIGTITAPTFQGTATTATNLADAANITTGIVSTARLSGTYDISISGNVATATTASGLTTTASVNTTGIITASSFVGNLTGTATTANNVSSTINIDTSGIITATTFSTGISTQNIGFTTGIISGPNTIFINPYQIGVSTGTVRILGNLTVDGTTVTTTQATIQSSATTIGVAVSETSNIVLDGAGITIGSTSIQKTLLWNYGSSSLKSSENLNVALGKVYQINDNPILSSTELASSVVNAPGITTVGTLKQLVVSGNTSSDAVKITQIGSGNALVVEDETSPDGTAFIVSANGSIGIGTTIPSYKLTITNNALPTSGLTHAIADFTGSVDGYTQLNIRNSLAAANASSDLIATADTGSDTTNFIDLGINNSTFSSGSWTVNGALDGYLYTSDGSLSIGVATSNTEKYLSFFVGGLLEENEKIRINQSSVGIGTTNPTSKLHVVGNALITGVTTSTDFDSLSDFNLKTNIRQIENSLSKVIQIRGVTFDWKETNRSSAGVIAQEVEKVLPQLVNGEDIKTVNYNGVIGALVEAVKELKAENDILKERLDEVYKKVFG